jgi:hypothetical protein
MTPQPWSCLNGQLDDGIYHDAADININGPFVARYIHIVQ